MIYRVIDKQHEHYGKDLLYVAPMMEGSNVLGVILRDPNPPNSTAYRYDQVIKHPYVARKYSVAELSHTSLSKEFLEFIKTSEDPFVMDRDGIHYLCLESLEGVDMPEGIQLQYELICNAVGYPRVWWIRVDEEV